MDAETAGLRYSLALPGTVLALGQGSAHQQQALRALALFDTADPLP